MILSIPYNIGENTRKKFRHIPKRCVDRINSRSHGYPILVQFCRLINLCNPSIIDSEQHGRRNVPETLTLQRLRGNVLEIVLELY